MSRNPPAVQFNHSYQQLMGATAWSRLHPAIRHRFSSDNTRRAATYKGVMDTVYRSTMGCLFAHSCYFLGPPLTPYGDQNIPVTVAVYPNLEIGGMKWDRYYHHCNGKVFRVQSTKYLHPSFGLAELVGAGLGMQLRLTEDNGALVFSSEYFFWHTRWFRLKLPDWITPGKTTVKQVALDEQRFIFELLVQHCWLGKVFYQRGVFQAIEKNKL